MVACGAETVEKERQDSEDSYPLMLVVPAVGVKLCLEEEEEALGVGL